MNVSSSAGSSSCARQDPASATSEARRQRLQNTQGTSCKLRECCWLFNQTPYSNLVVQPNSLTLDFPESLWILAQSHINCRVYSVWPASVHEWPKEKDHSESSIGASRSELCSSCSYCSHCKPRSIIYPIYGNDQNKHSGHVHQVALTLLPMFLSFWFRPHCPRARVRAHYACFMFFRLTYPLSDDVTSWRNTRTSVLGIPAVSRSSWWTRTAISLSTKAALATLLSRQSCHNHSRVYCLDMQSFHEWLQNLRGRIKNSGGAQLQISKNSNTVYIQKVLLIFVLIFT